MCKTLDDTFFLNLETKIFKGLHMQGENSFWLLCFRFYIQTLHE